ncbi:MAG: cupin domain-containing protein [Balneolaceae bacterium]|nr:cupin domain-containing protein [Balneolaceae bacterium]MBO6547614.1 cupin domain-containing protein [Balneolaceae bacterium]MBO6648125.1 cupin domain-containing protein [Balneolaceae bacterium]
MKNSLYIISTLVLMLTSGWIGWEGRMLLSDLETKVITKEAATKVNEDWGNIIIYTDEASASTYGTENTLTAVAEIKPGMEIHPPHQHTAEEFLYVIEGEGTWSINGVESEAKAGDIMYSRPWDLHGITNTGDKPLRFFVMKWDNKGVKVPVLKEE